MCPASEHTDCIRGYIGSPTSSSSSSASSSSGRDGGGGVGDGRNGGGDDDDNDGTEGRRRRRRGGGGGGSGRWWLPVDCTLRTAYYARTQGALSARARPGNLVRHSSRRRFFPSSSSSASSTSSALPYLPLSPSFALPPPSASFAARKVR